MRKTEKTIRLIYPQWQGGYIASFVPEIKDPIKASQGYMLGSYLLNFLAPESKDETFTVPVSTAKERKLQDGLYDRDILAKQTHDAIQIIKEANPDKIVTLGGECSVSVAPFTYLSKKYDDDVAVIWLDAHPDITLPGEAYPAYHAMAVSACMGLGDNRILSELPSKISPKNILFVGLRDWERSEIKERQKEYGISHLTVDEVKGSSERILEWIKGTGAHNILIHFDLDVLDPTEIIPAVGVVKDGMSVSNAVRIINDIAQQSNLVALTIAEPMPRYAILIQDMLSKLPLINDKL